MAKVVITITDEKRGIDVQCHVEQEAKDSGTARTIAVAVSAGLAGHIMEKVRNAIHTVKKGKVNVH